MYRVFIDEVGTHDIKSCQKPTEQYLGLTGVIMRLVDEQGALTTALNQLKNTIFGDTNVVFHRRDIIDRKKPFDVLNNAQTQGQFDSGLTALLQAAHYNVFTAVIDKKEHALRYRVWRF